MKGIAPEAARDSLQHLQDDPGHFPGGLLLGQGLHDIDQIVARADQRRLALEIGIEGEALLQVRRGALLHDIGKIAIPDCILLKPGELTSEEWVPMRQHPVYAYETLSSIPYLRPALDIPYCHHERWDGSGYPQGLTGEDIPLAARIFAVVDVWDALTSDRPYRNAWPEEKVEEYFHNQSGKKFDPKIVDTFFYLKSLGEI